ncbi:MAG: hypothetical protein GC162_20155 [Planctomycetes bacterium]|nr:hypothetical protein [Planctomycetota bacterium]
MSFSYRGFLSAGGRKRSRRAQRARKRAATRARGRLNLETLEQRLLLTVLVPGLELDPVVDPAVDPIVMDATIDPSQANPELDVTEIPDLTIALDAATIAELNSYTPLAALSDTFALHSNAGASKKVYLDFTGYVTSGTIWNSTFTGGANIVTAAYDIDGNASAFSDTELSRIQYIWQRVAEDYLPFDVDITTEDPGAAALTKSGGSDTDWGIRVVIGGSSTDWYGSAGGVAYVGSFNWNSDTPAFVFTAQLGNGHEKYTAEAISHEVGHTLGLSHDGNASTGYYAGQGSGTTGWAPIMGVGYYQNLTQWSKGEYAGANNTQDDLAIISSQNGFGYRADDYGNTNAAAAALATPSSTTVAGVGIIERTTDVDVFSFTTGAGSVSLNINPADRGANLDILAELYDSSGNLITSSNPSTLLSASINSTLAAGTYYLHISGVGNGDPATTGYSDYASLGQYSISGTIVAPDQPPTPTTPSITISDATVNENAGTASFTVSLSAASAQSISVDLATADNTATAGSDYTAKSQTLTFAAGEISKTFTVAITNDSLVEPTESFFVNLTNVSGATIADNQAVGTILDNDIALLGVNDVTVNEADGTATFTLSLTNASATAISVNVATANGTALAGSDYTAKSQTVTFAAGQTTQTFTVAILNDSTVESTETFLVNLSSASGATIADGQGVGTIIDDDVMPTPALSISDASVNESAGTATFTLSLSNASSSAVSVLVATADDTALAGSDYTAKSQTITFAAGETTKTFTVAITNDTLVESTETFFVNLSNVSGATLADAQAVGRIVDNDIALVSIGDAVVNEGDGTATFTLSLTNASATAISVNVATANGTALAGSDYTAKSQTVTFAAGQTTQTFTVAILNDSTVESTETFLVNLSGASGATIADGQGVGTIHDDDVAPVITPAFSINDTTVNETDGTATFTVSLSQAMDHTVSVVAGLASGTAVGRYDFNGRAATLTFAAGQTTATYSVSIINDNLVESDEVFYVNLSRASAGVDISDGQGVCTIVSEDVPPPAISINDISVNESDGTATFTLSLDKASDQTVTVVAGLANGTARGRYDFNGRGERITFEAGQTTATYTVTIVDDSIYEGDETFSVVLSRATNATIADNRGVCTIVDNETPPPAISINDVSVNENDGTATFTLSLDKASDQTVTVVAGLANGTARGRYDFNGRAERITFEAGQTTATYTVSIIDDAIYEGDETFSVMLSRATNATIASNVGHGTIVENETPPPMISINDVSVNEDAGTATFTISLDKASDQSVSVIAGLANGTARGRYDFTGATQRITFDPGQTTRTYTVSIVNDHVLESDETFRVVLSRAINSEIARSQGIGTIVDDEVPPPRVSIAGTTVSESDGTAMFELTLDKPSDEVVQAVVGLANGTARGRYDFAGATQVITFEPGETSKMFSVSIVDDNTVENTETFRAGIARTTNAMRGDDYVALGTIIDDDAPAGADAFGIASAKAMAQMRIQAALMQADAFAAGPASSWLNPGDFTDSHDPIDALLKSPAA